VHVRDQDHVLAFSTGKLHFEKRTDMPMGPDQRWIEVAPPGAQTLRFTRFVAVMQVARMTSRYIQARAHSKTE